MKDALIGWTLLMTVPIAAAKYPMPGWWSVPFIIGAVLIARRGLLMVINGDPCPSHIDRRTW